MTKTKRLVLILSVLLLVLLTGMLLSVLPNASNTSVVSDTARINAAHGDPSLLEYGEIVNLVVLICFSDEIPSAEFPSADIQLLTERFNGEAFSLFDYYRTISYGALAVRSVFPTVSTGNTAYYVYKAQNSRSYYETRTSDGVRYTRESGLLNAAVRAAEEHFDLTGVDLDVNKDGKTDCVSFVISGERVRKNWGSLMWTHFWNLDTISKSANATTATVNGLTVDSYTFTFKGDSIGGPGAVSHEFGHALGLPDYYHYDYNTDRLPVGCWDIMHLNCTSPQYPLVYSLDKYLSFADKKQIRELTVSGEYTLTPTASTAKDHLIAYKITISDKESIWLEYRTADASTYDRDLPSSGLVVYRVNSSASGNEKGRYHSTTYPDEVFVYRHSVATEGSTNEKELYDLNRAPLSVDGFSTFGSKTATASYASTCIYLTNGSNTGIVVTVTEQTNEELTFTVDLGKYDCSRIDESYVTGSTLTGKSVKDEHHIYFGEEPRVSVYLKYNNRSSAVELYDFTIEYDKKKVGQQTANVVFTDTYGERRIPFTLHVYDVPSTLYATVVSSPYNTTLHVGESLSLEGLVIRIDYLSERSETIAYSEENKNEFAIVEGLDTSAHGTYDHVKGRYGTDVYFTLTGITVLSNLLSIRVDERNTTHLKGDSFSPTFTVIGSYRDGTEEVLPSSSYVAQIDAGTSFDKTIVVIRSKLDEDVVTSTYVYGVGCETVTGLALTENVGSLIAEYGEEPNISDMRLTVTFSNGRVLTGNDALLLKNYASQLFKSYNPTKVGKQILTLTLGTGSVSLDVTVTPKSTDLLRLGQSLLSSVRVDEDLSTVTVYSPTDLKTFADNVTSKLRIVYVDVQNGYELNAAAFSSRFIGYETVLLELRSTSGITVATYKMYLCGDANGDGLLTEEDKKGWLEAILRGNEYEYEYLDVNFDGAYTLTDLVLLLQGGIS